MMVCQTSRRSIVFEERDPVSVRAEQTTQGVIVIHDKEQVDDQTEARKESL